MQKRHHGLEGFIYYTILQKEKTHHLTASETARARGHRNGAPPPSLQWCPSHLLPPAIIVVPLPLMGGATLPHCGRIPTLHCGTLLFHSHPWASSNPSSSHCSPFPPHSLQRQLGELLCGCLIILIPVIWSSTSPYPCPTISMLSLSCSHSLWSSSPHCHLWAPHCCCCCHCSLYTAGSVSCAWSLSAIFAPSLSLSLLPCPHHFHHLPIIPTLVAPHFHPTNSHLWWGLGVLQWW